MRGLLGQIVKWWNRDDDLNKIAKFKEEQTHLEIRREKIQADILALEDKEADLIVQGTAAVSGGRKSASRRLANNLFHLRQDLKRQSAVAGLISKRITIIATDVHNLSIVSEGKALGFDVDVEQLTENAVAAEECVEHINAAADMAQSLTDDQSQILESAASFGEYDDIMKEFGEVPDAPVKTIENIYDGQVTPEELTAPAVRTGNIARNKERLEEV